ncbi:hypothetical protein E3P86_01530, partial [Wallemia ichthyophaga]
LKPTHFISVPLTRLTSIRPRLNQIRAKLIQVEIDGIKEEDFVKSTKLHFTLGLLRLSETTIPTAIALLDSLKPDIIKLLSHNNLIHMNNLGCFPNENNARVLYYRPSENGILDIVSGIVRKKFREEGLLSDTGPPTLHCTILKTSSTQKKLKRPNFSYSSVQKSLGDLNIGGPYPFERIEIAAVGTTTPEGYYAVEGGIAL